MNVETIRKQLRVLKLSTAAQEMEEVLNRHKQAASLEWVSALLERVSVAAKKGTSLAGEREPLVRLRDGLRPHHTER